VRISIVCSNRAYPIFPYLERWLEAQRARHDLSLVTEVSALNGGDLLFLISCSEIVPAVTRARFGHALVVHASALPRGRGWSPHIWQILEGAGTIPVSLLEAEDRVDSGAIWKQVDLQLDGTELYDEINAKLFDVELQLMSFAVENLGRVAPRDQSDAQPTYYRKRVPEDSRLDPYKSIAEQFNLLRVADPVRFPCFLEYKGGRYIVSLKKDERP
jgi:methionyl-tRNA formyltransferase